MERKFVLSAVVVALAYGASYSAERTVFVAPNNAAVRDGSAAYPFATPGEAQAAVRARMASGEHGPWTISLASGEYPISESFTFTPDDSGEPGAPVTWRGPAGGAARIVGARELKGWRVRPDGRWETDVPIEKKPRFQVAVWFEQLYVNGRRAKRARYPNEGFLQAKGAKPTLLAGDTELMELFANGDDLAPLAACSFAHLRLAHLVVHHKWSSSRRPIRGYDAARGVVFTEGRSVTKWNTWDANSTYYVENAPFALDEPGEWLYDGEAKKIVYIPRPGETLETTRFQYPVPGLVTLLRIAGDPEKETFVHDIVFENIAFAFSDSPRRQSFNGIKGLPSGVIGDDSSFGPSEWPGGQAAAHTSAAVLADGAHRIVMRGCTVVQRQDVRTVAGQRQRRSRGRDGSAIRGPRETRLPSEARIARGEGGIPSVRHLRRRRGDRAVSLLERRRYDLAVALVLDLVVVPHVLCV